MKKVELVISFIDDVDPLPQNDGKDSVLNQPYRMPWYQQSQKPSIFYVNSNDQAQNSEIVGISYNRYASVSDFVLLNQGQPLPGMHKGG